MGHCVVDNVYGRAWPALTIMALVGAMAACSSVPFVGMHATPTGSTQPSREPPRLVEFATAWPKVVPRSVDWQRLEGGMAFIESGATLDGELALGEATVGPRGSFIGPAILDRRTNGLSILRRFTNPQTQVTSTAGDVNWIAWVEGSNPFGFADWALYSFHRMTHQIRLLAQAPKPYPATAYFSISMSHGVIVWSAVGADALYRVYSINADGTDSKVLASDARGPQIVWPWVMYDAKPTKPGAGAQMVMQNIESGEVKDLANPTDVAYFAFDGQSIAWVTGDTNDIYLMAPIGSAPLHVYSGRYLQFVSMNSRIVGWGQDKGALAYDRKLNLIVHLSSLYDFYPVMSDTALDWLFQPNPNASDPFANTLQEMVDIRELP